MFMPIYFSSRAKREGIYCKLRSRCFVDLRPPYWCPSVEHPTWRLYTKLCKIEWHVLASNLEMMLQTDTRLGGVLYVWVFYNISFSWLLSLNGFGFYFLCDSENTQLHLKLCDHLQTNPIYWFLSVISWWIKCIRLISVRQKLQNTQWHVIKINKKNCHHILTWLNANNWLSEAALLSLVLHCIVI